MSEERVSIAALATQLVVTHGEDFARYQIERLIHGRATPEQRAKAIARHADEDVSIDDDALVSMGDTGDGYWVSAWVWCHYPLCDACDEPHRPGAECDPDALATAVAQGRSEL